MLDVISYALIALGIITLFCVQREWYFSGRKKYFIALIFISLITSKFEHFFKFNGCLYFFC